MSLQGLNIARSGLAATQAAMDIINNNIANMNTKGYSKQKLELATDAISRPIMGPDDLIKVNNGVVISEVTRTRDELTDKYLRDESTSFGYYQELVSHTQLIETVTNELGNSGLSGVMSDFFDAANQLATEPTDSVLRTQFIQKSVDVANKFQSISSDLKDIRKGLVGDVSQSGSLDSSQISLEVQEVNDILKELAEVNESIGKTTKENTPLSLLDHRDLLLDELAEYIPITYSESESGEMSVYTGNVQLISKSTVLADFSVAVGDIDNPAIVSIDSTESGNTVVADIKSVYGEQGKLRALLDLGGADVTKLSLKASLDKLDDLAREFAQEVNAIQLYRDPAVPEASMCLTYDGSGNEILELATSPIFLDQPAETALNENLITAENIQVNTIILNNPNKIATAILETDAGITGPLAGTQEQVGNSQSALKFARLRDKSIADLSSLTIEEAIKDYTTDAGVKIDSINTNHEIKESIVTQAELTRQSKMGVNLDEELIDLVKFQRAYEASAKVFSTINDVFQILMGLAR